MDELKAMRFCDAVARTGSFTRAAEAMAIAQPALSIAIAKFESRLGVTLFHRQPRGAEPTPEGRLLLAHARRLFDEFDSMKRELADATALNRGTLSIGYPPIYGRTAFPKRLAVFRARHPSLEIHASAGSATATAEALDAGTLDLAIVEARRLQPNWRSVPLDVDELVIAVGNRHPLRRVRTLEPRHLAGLPMALLGPDFLQRQLLDAWCAQHGVAYRPALECNDIHLTLLAVEAGGVGATLLRSVVAENRRLVAIGFDPPQRFDFRLCWRKDRYLSRAASAFIDSATDPSSVGPPRR